MKPLAPRLRHRINIEQLTHDIESEGGSMSDEWVSVLVDEPAEIVPLSGREFIAGQAVTGQVVARITIRQRTGTAITPSMRVTNGGEIYNVRAVLPDPTLRRWLSLMCDRGVNNG